MRRLSPLQHQSQRQRRNQHQSLRQRPRPQWLWWHRPQHLRCRQQQLLSRQPQQQKVQQLRQLVAMSVAAAGLNSRRHLTQALCNLRHPRHPRQQLQVKDRPSLPPAKYQQHQHQLEQQQ